MRSLEKSREEGSGREDESEETSTKVDPKMLQ